MDRFADEGELASVLGDWTEGPGPLYQKLVDALRRVIAEGELLPGFLLPSERRLARALEVSRATVVAAYDLLRDEGMLSRKVGSGTRVHPSVRALQRARPAQVPHGGATALMRRLVDGPGRVISLTTADSGLDIANDLACAMLEVIDDLPALLSDSGYHPRGLSALREALARHHSGQGPPTTADEIVVTTGATQSLVLIAQMYVTRGSIVVVESPSWPGCLDVFRAAGAELVAVPMDEDGVRPDLLADTVATLGPALIYLMPNYHNPTGALMPKTRRRQVAQIAARYGVPLVEDCATGLSGEMPAPIAAFAPERAEVLTLGSLGKTVWSGLRLGWTRAPAAVAGVLAGYKALADMGSSLLPQAVATSLMPRLTELAAERAAAQRIRREALEELLREQLPDWRWRSPAGGSALWIELPGVNAQIFAQVALQHGVEVVPGALADPSGRHDSYIRLPCTFSAEAMVAVVRKLAGAWARLSERSSNSAGLSAGTMTSGSRLDGRPGVA
ncbi:PLP-dependent aminotransferase family protein [Spongiactinospora sp. 9N601]|uniref:aminotransferase-like domain-containing protein n=1 Tax=Spongiactinospora sp. 9N601 TaxID=3375149 RepID=UPI003787F42E